ncbi:hypothetical protein D3C86_1172810 [compost metagenome]
MMTRCFGFSSEINHIPIIENRETITDNRRFYRLLNDIVRHQNVRIALRLSKDVEKIFPIRRCNFAEKLNIFQMRIKNLVNAILQIITIRKNDALIVRKQNRRFLQRR